MTLLKFCSAVLASQICLIVFSVVSLCLGWLMGGTSVLSFLRLFLLINKHISLQHHYAG